MTNGPKIIGTACETKYLRYLRQFFPDAEKTRPYTPSHDIEGCPWPVEIKKRAKWEISQWAKLLKRQHGKVWVLITEPRDTRKLSNPPIVVTMTLPVFDELLTLAYGKTGDWDGIEQADTSEDGLGGDSPLPGFEGWKCPTGADGKISPELRA